MAITKAVVKKKLKQNAPKAGKTSGAGSAPRGSVDGTAPLRAELARNTRAPSSCTKMDPAAVPVRCRIAFR